MSDEVTEIETISQLTEVLVAEVEHYDGPIWYRGHADQSYSLVPGYYRKDARVSEHSLLIKFKQSATMLIDRPTADSFDWLFLMQHYGVPTRLLDWSESPLVALYFCVSEQQETDGAIWLLKPSELNKHARIHAKSEDGFVPSFQDDELQSYTIESLRSNDRVSLLPVATIASRNNPRIQAQLGAFTIHHHERVALENVGDGKHVAKITVKAEAKKRIKKELDLLGYSRFQMFPELASVGDLLKGEV